MGKMTGTSNIGQIDELQRALTETIERARVEQDDREKKKLILNIEKYNSRIDKLRSGRMISRQTRRDLIAYSFIAPNFIGFCVFTLIPIIFAFALAFMKWDGSNPVSFEGIDNFKRLWGEIGRAHV